MAARTVLHRSRKFTLERIEPPAGRGHAHDVVVHPGAAVILPLLDADTAVLTHNRRIAVGRELLELPAGTLEPPEPPIECARRELAEETGYRAGHLKPLCKFYSAPGFCNELLHAFVATELTAGEQSLDESEEIKIQPMKWPDALAAIADGRIVDAKTIAAILYYDRFRR
ncbi:MAG: NUDIX hydrolase [Phycisphaerales bacterium]|nr:NUDIX hydrolase [Phycisphaerales bacterium]